MPRTGQQQVVTAPTLQKGAFHLSEGAQRPDAHEFRLPISPLHGSVVYHIYASFTRKSHFFWLYSIGSNQALRVCRQVVVG